MRASSKTIIQRVRASCSNWLHSLVRTDQNAEANDKMDSFMFWTNHAHAIHSEWLKAKWDNDEQRMRDLQKQHGNALKRMVKEMGD